MRLMDLERLEDVARLLFGPGAANLKRRRFFRPSNVSGFPAEPLGRLTLVATPSGPLPPARF
jgi:hypothetical protein